MTKEEAWSAFADQYNHRLHGPSDAFKFAWKAATEAEREACAVVCDELDMKDGVATWYSQAIRARGEA